MIDRVYLTYAAQFIVREFLTTFKEFPPRMKPASFSIDQVLEKMEQGFEHLLAGRRSAGASAP